MDTLVDALAEAEAKAFGTTLGYVQARTQVNTLAEKKGGTPDVTVGDVEAQALANNFENTLAQSETNALGNTLGDLVAKVQSTRWLTLLKMRAQGHLTTQ